jgi:ERF superfamily
MTEVYKAINKVQAKLAELGISKDKKNAAQGFNFRGIDDVLNALAPCLAEHELCILPRVMSRECTERSTGNGKAMFCAVVTVEYDFVSAADGSKHTVSSVGEAMDMADKATNKAMSAAFKYMAFQAFCIPTEGMEDADAITPPESTKTKVAPPKPVDLNALAFPFEEFPAGTPYSDLSVPALERLATRITTAINDPAKATFKAGNEATLKRVQAAMVVP